VHYQDTTTCILENAYCIIKIIRRFKNMPPLSEYM
jgi:hypothetical protein